MKSRGKLAVIAAFVLVALSATGAGAARQQRAVRLNIVSSGHAAVTPQHPTTKTVQKCPDGTGPYKNIPNSEPDATVCQDHQYPRIVTCKDGYSSAPKKISLSQAHFCGDHDKPKLGIIAQGLYTTNTGNTKVCVTSTDKNISYGLTVAPYASTSPAAAHTPGQGTKQTCITYLAWPGQRLYASVLALPTQKPMSLTFKDVAPPPAGYGHDGMFNDNYNFVSDTGIVKVCVTVGIQPFRTFWIQVTQDGPSPTNSSATSWTPLPWKQIFPTGPSGQYCQDQIGVTNEPAEPLHVSVTGDANMSVQFAQPQDENS